MCTWRFLGDCKCRQIANQDRKTEVWGVGQVLRASCSSVLRLMAASGISRNELLRRSLALALSMYRLLQAEASLVPENELLADGAKPAPLFAWGGAH